MSLESNKSLGGVGAILLAIPFLSLVGIILVLLAMKGMAEHYKEDGIFKNALYGFVFGVIGVVAMMAVVLLLIFGFAATTTISSPFTGFGLFVISYLVLYGFSLTSAIFYRKSLNALSEKSGESMFSTAGLVLLFGAAIPVVGELLKFIAWILVAVGFFNIKSTSPQQSASAPVETKSTVQTFCKYCGSKIQPNTVYCPNCGKKIE
jgi:uncharacterized membrane protein